MTASHGKNAPSRTAAWRARVADRLARSSRVFLLGLMVACGIEVVVDLNQTLFEINVLRSAVRQKGDAYVGILAKASEEELSAADVAGLEHLSSGIFDDEDAEFVRFTDASGKVVWEKAEVSPEHPRAADFSTHYAHLMERDEHAILTDPDGFKQRILSSRYKDFPQVYADTTAKVAALISPPKPAPTSHGLIVYQDRLRTETHERDEVTTYALGTVVADGKTIGTTLVAFDMDRTNAGVHMKYLKFAGMVTFFVALILVQSTLSRRDKLRLLDLEARYTTAKRALVKALPDKDLKLGGLVVSGALEQAKGPVDGMIWGAVEDDDSVMVLAVDPDGDGIDAAAVGLQVAKTFKARPAKARSLDDEILALGLAATDIPLTRPIGVFLLRAKTNGDWEALFGSFATLRKLRGARVQTPTAEPVESDAPEGVVGPLFRAAGTLDFGESLVILCAGMGKKEHKLEADALATYVARTHEAGKLVAVEDAAIWMRGRNSALVENDLIVLSVSRSKMET